MGIAPEVSFVIKHTFLEFSEFQADISDAKPSRSHAFTDTELLESAGLISTSRAPAKEAPSVACSPVRRLAVWPETPMLDAIFEPESTSNSPLFQDMQQWMLPAAGEQDQMPWMFVPCGDYSEFCAMQGMWPVEWPRPESTASGEEISGADSISGDSLEVQSGGDWRTTVMLRNLPNALTRDMLLHMLDEKGFLGLYDLVYLPVDFSTGTSLGYAFVNGSTPGCVQQLWEAFDGKADWPVESDKVCTVSWSDPHQGLASHIERYQNSPVMHPDVPDEWKPALFMHGMRVDFPPATKKIKAPKVRSKKAADVQDEAARDSQ
mmetsp:Transcript_28283/g.93890  ORF Transcript_28283/g.93890 Transcript_28283/m.93890 type:complete len:320 (-) Transcript_28283:494-1453(-)